MILRKKLSIGTIFSCVPALPGSQHELAAGPALGDLARDRFLGVHHRLHGLHDPAYVLVVEHQRELSVRVSIWPALGRVHQHGHVAVRMAVLVHELVHVGDLVEAEGLRQAGVDLAGQHQVVQRPGVVVVREVRALEALLPHPVVAQVERGVVAGGAGADHHHAARVAHEDRGGHGVLARVLEHEARALALADRFPERRAEGARALQPTRRTPRRPSSAAACPSGRTACG